MAKKKLKEEQVIEALKQSHGLKTGAAELLGVSFPTIERYIADSTAAQEIIAHWKNRRIDRAEYKLDEAIERGEGWASSSIGATRSQVTICRSMRTCRNPVVS